MRQTLSPPPLLLLQQHSSRLAPCNSKLTRHLAKLIGVFPNSSWNSVQYQKCMIIFRTISKNMRVVASLLWKYFSRLLLTRHLAKFLVDD